MQVEENVTVYNILFLNMYNIFQNILHFKSDFHASVLCLYPTSSLLECLHFVENLRTFLVSAITDRRDR